MSYTNGKPLSPEVKKYIVSVKQLDRGFNKVTAHTCSEIIKEINNVEDEFWKEDLDADENE